MPRHSVFVEAKAQKKIRKIATSDKDRIIAVLKVLEEEGFSNRLDIKKLQSLRKNLGHQFLVRKPKF